MCDDSKPDMEYNWPGVGHNIPRVKRKRPDIGHNMPRVGRT